MTEQQENNQPGFLDLLLEAHVGLERQGPGSRETVERALSFLGDLSRFKSIADLGCVKPGLKTKGYFWLMHLMQKSGWNEADMRYWREKGWTGKARPWKKSRKGE